LRQAIATADAAVLLFPDEAALTLDEFMQQRLCTATSAATDDDQHVDGDCQTASRTPELSIIVIDGTWNNVKQVLKHFNTQVGPETPHVRLQPTSLSVYARTQTRKDGVSSVEAIALLLRELGESDEVCSSLIDYIEINNGALRLRPPERDGDHETEPHSMA